MAKFVKFQTIEGDEWIAVDSVLSVRKATGPLTHFVTGETLDLDGGDYVLLVQQYASSPQGQHVLLGITVVGVVEDVVAQLEAAHA